MYPLKNGKKCKSVSTSNLVENCYKYDESQSCVQCRANYALSVDQLSCIAISGTSNCLNLL